MAEINYVKDNEIINKIIKYCNEIGIYPYVQEAYREPISIIMIEIPYKIERG